MENRIIHKIDLGITLNEVTAEAKRMYPGYNLQTSLTHYLGFCWSVKTVRGNNSMDYKIMLAGLLINAFENYRIN